MANLSLASVYLALIRTMTYAHANRALVDYASALALELHASADVNDPFLTFKFKNGTSDAEFHPVSLGVFGGNTSVALSTFVSTLSVCALLLTSSAYSSLTRQIA